MSANSKDKSLDARREVGCVNCSRPDSYDNFVQCDHCDNWWHMRCAGVTNSISERPWTCSTCLPLSVSSSSSNAARIALRLKLLEEERAIQQREWEAEKRAFEQEKKVMQEKYRLLEEQLAAKEDGSRRSQVSRRSSMRRISTWIQNLAENPELEGAVGGATVGGNPILVQQDKSFDESEANQLPAERNQPSTDGQQQKSFEKSSKQLALLDPQASRTTIGSQQRNTGAYPKTVQISNNLPSRVNTTTGKVSFPAPPLLPSGKLPINIRTNENMSALPSEDPYESLLARLGSVSVSPKFENSQPAFLTESILQDHVIPTVSHPPAKERNENELELSKANTDYVNISQTSPFSCTAPNVSEHVPSPSQLAARQVMPRDLPPFTGDPADWPIFISAFENTSVACGYSRVENLARLQRCLKGAAYESVRSRLLLPESVPQVISTLRLLFGRPELLINVMLDKVRSTPAPKAEKLETLIEFGMAVQCLCDHLQAAGQQSHLSNPCLLMELVEKLPGHVKMEWASYMQRHPDVNLKTFGDFMSGMVISASKVTLYSGGCGKGGSVDRTKVKSRGSINAHIAEPDLQRQDKNSCCVCEGHGHYVRECETFNALSVDDRWKTVQIHELCRSCLTAHGRRSCRYSRQCGIDGCTYRHHRLLHSIRNNRTSAVNLARNVETSGTHTHRAADHTLLFRILPVTLHGPLKSINTYAFLDDGSHLTLVEDQLARDLGVEGRTIPLCLTLTGNVSRMEANSKQFQLVVSGADGRNQLKLNDVRTVKRLALPGQTLRVEDLENTFEYLRGLPIAGYENAIPRLLIGVNNLHLTVPLKVKEGRVSEPIAVKTRLGWCVYGGSSNSSSSSINIHACDCSIDGVLHEMVKNYFTLDDVKPNSSYRITSAEEKRAQDILQATTFQTGERYETGLLWKQDEIELPESYGMAMRRLECLERRMGRNPSLKQNLHRQIEEYQQKGYAHRVSDEEMKRADLKRVWYLPLGAVTNPKKPEKVRIIWDAAAMVDGTSLNSMLLKGPDQLVSLAGVLFRFRQYNVAVSADIKEMFHQIRIREEDRHSQRFLWRDDPTKPAETFVMDVATFGSTCSPASAQYVKNLNATKFAKKYPKAAKDIIENTYVDDYLASFQTKADAAETSAQVRTIQQAGGFSLRNWQSNSTSVIQALGEPVEPSRMHLFQDKSQTYERILGMLWLTEDDALCFCTQLKDDVHQIIYSNSHPTKRQVLRCFMSFFDPLGLLGFLLVHGKILLQDIWRAGTQWDEEVEEEHWNRWRDWTSLLRHVSDIRLPRCYFPEATELHYQQLQLHVFVDASEAAYAAVAYFRIVDPNGIVRCVLVSTRTKVAPLRPLSIPRLELQAAVLGTRLMRFVQESHTLVIKERYLWSDSSTVLAWLRADPRKYKQYVACRIGEILSETEVREWQWVPTKLNPADLATKWGCGPSLNTRSMWFTGPPYLLEPADEWPKQKISHQTVEVELRACMAHSVPAVRLPVIDFNRFSKWERLHRATAYVHRYVGNLKRTWLGVAKNIGCLTQEELRQAETTLIAEVQWQEYPSEMVVLYRNRNCPDAEKENLNRSSVLYQLTPFVDEAGVLRIDGRIGAAKHVCNDMKFPVILPRKHRITELIVDMFHRKFQHANSETVVNEIRQRYYVPHLRTIVRRITNECTVCKVRKAVPHIPRMASLPPARLASFTRPFTYVGLDYFGPFVVKVGRGNAKRWIALFTCLTIRAVHCEIVCNLSTDACLKAIRRFVCRRGAPAEIYSDNGTNFQGAERILMKEIQQDMAETLTSTTTNWLFIPPASPHMGGAWERMVRSIKQAMMSAYRCDRKLDDESLHTFVIEAESMVNNRPLTYLPLDAAEMEVQRPKQSEIRDFYIESLEESTSSPEAHSRHHPVGRFLDSNQLSNSDRVREAAGEDDYRPVLSNTWIDDLEADWASEHPRRKPSQPAGSRTRLDPIRWNSIQPNIEAYFDEGDVDAEDDDDEVLDGSFLPRDCLGHVWKQDLMFEDRMMMNWSVPVGDVGLFGRRSSGSSSNGSSRDSSQDNKGQRNRTVYFRILYRTMTSHIVNELIYTMVLLKECNLLLKETSGSLDSGKLPAEYDDCRIGFPSRLEDLEQQQQQQQLPPGLVVQLTRLNIPCRADGGYLKFNDSISGGSADGLVGGSGDALKSIDRDHVVNGERRLDAQPGLLCGKLEELPKHERTFYFQRHRNTSVVVHNRAVFSFNYRLVDYCYNVTLSDRNSSVLLRPLRGLNCRFKIHLPYGNRVRLRLVVNADGDSVNSSVLDREQVDLSLNQGVVFTPQCFGGLRVDVFELPQNRWVQCVDSYSRAAEYTLLSSDNSIVIQVSKNSLLAALEDEANANNSSSSSRKSVPSLLIEYNSHPIENVVSQCAFGWIASNQFCIAPFESERLSWVEAERQCNHQGGHLASIRSVADQKLVDQLLLKSPGYRDGNAYWIGASDRMLEGDFRWSDSLPFTYSNWFPGWIQQHNYNRQPNDDGLSGQDCVEIRRQFQTPPGISSGVSPLSESYMWNDRDCDTRNFFLCERLAVEEPLEKTWHDDCNKTISLTMDRPKATIWSPGFPRPYPDNVNCLTMITAPPGYRIVVDFEELVLENEPLCTYDYLQILEPPANFSAAYSKPSRSAFGGVPLFQTRNPRHSTSRYYVRRRKSNFLPSKVDISDRLMSTFTSKTPNLILQPEDPSYNLRLPPPDLYTGRVPRKVCGDWSSKLKLLRHTTKGPLLALRFVSDYSNHYGGYKAKVAMENVISECYDERFKAYNASCYSFISFPEADWMTAQQICRLNGAQLASISTTDEQRFITFNIRNSLDYTPRALYWVGGELTEAGELEWADGTKLLFEGWLPGQRPEPTQSPQASMCLGLQWKISPTPMISSGLHWSAQQCSARGGYVCKKPRPTADENMVKNQTVSGTEGRLDSPNPYPAHTDYWVRLVAPEGNRIIIQFQMLDIEFQEECLYDYVSIQNFQIVPNAPLNPGTNPQPMAMFWDGRTEGLLSADYSNDQPYRPLLTGDYSYDQKSTSPPRQEKFYRKRSLSANDDIQQKLQDNIKLLEKINSKLKDRKKRFLSSDNYKTVKNSSQSITLESNSAVEPVVEETDPSFLPYVRWCGTHDANMTRFNFISSGNEAFLRFHSDFSVGGRGYTATWSTVDVSGCPVQTITSREGTISSPNYPHFLLNNLDCTFIIQAPYGKKVWLEFSSFDILLDAIVYVDISEGPFEPFRDESHVNDGVFLSKGERLVVRLKTGSLPRGKGFHATFKTLSSAAEQRSIHLGNRTSGNMFYLNYPQSMPYEIDFTQHLIAPLGDVILLELHGVGFSEHGCHKSGFIEIFDNYADKNGTLWHLCELNHLNASVSKAYSAEYKRIESSLAKPAPIYITSYLNTLHIRQRNVQGMGVRLNATIRLQNDIGYKMKLITNEDEWVESCKPNPCQYGGKCVMQKDDRGICQCRGHYTGRFCGLTMCELEPCYFGKCELTQSSFKCHCQPGYMGKRCDEKPKPCEDNPCEGRGECHPKNGGYFCRCHAWWEGPRCEKRMMHIPYKPLSERMLQEPFWLGLITVFVVLAVIGLVWCAKRHFPEKIEKLLADEAHRNRPANFPPHHLNTALREQLQATAVGTVPSSTATTPATHRTIFGRLGIRKPSILSLSSPQQVGGATARTFSLDDLLRPPPRRTPSPRKKRNNSTPTKKNVNEKKQILQQLVSPAPNSATKQVSLGELIQLSENRLKVHHAESESDLKETTFSEHSLSVSSMVRQISDPKLEKKVTFARLLSKVSAEMSSGSEDLANGTKHSSALSLPTEVPQRANSVPPSPSTNEIRSPHSTSSNQGSDSLSSSELALHDFGLRGNRRVRPKVSSADSILAMFKNFATSSAGINLPSSIVISPSSTPTASSPQDDVAGDDDSSTSSIHTPVSFSSGAPDSPVFYRQSTIEVPVLDALSAHKTTPSATTTTTTQLHPPTILLEIPSNGINNKCLSPIREMPTPIPSPALTPIMPRPQRMRSPQNMHEESMSVTFSGDYSGYNNTNPNQVTIEINHPESDTDSPTPTNLSSQSDSNSSNGSSRSRKTPPPPKISISIDVQPPTPERERAVRPRDLVIPELIIQQPSPTKERSSVVMFPGSPPPQRASIGETSFHFPNKQQQKRLLKQWEKPGSLDLPFEPPMITITSNMSELESDADCMSPAATGKPNGTNTLGVSGSSVGMCYLSPFSMCTRGDRAPSESNLSSSGYSSMASPGPSRCGSSNPLCPSEMEDPGTGSGGTGFPGLSSMMGANMRRHTSILKKHNEAAGGAGGTATGGSSDRHESFWLRSDSETLSDDPLLESNDEGIGTDHLDEKIEEGEIKSAKELELFIGKELIENGRDILNQTEVASMSQLQLPSIVIQSESGVDKLSPVSSRSESPLSDRTASMERFSPLFYGRKDQQLPFTDSDGLYDFPSSDGKGSSTIHHRKSTVGRRRERRSSRSGATLSPSKSNSILLEIPSGNTKDNNGSGSHHVTMNSHSVPGSKFSCTTPTRKSPKRRPLYRHPIASSSSSTESLTSTREYAQRSSKAFMSFTRETHLCDSGDDTGEDVSSQILPKVTVEDISARPQSKIGRLRAIGNQIRFLRRLERSIRQKDRLIAVSDEDAGSSPRDSPRVTSPLLKKPDSSGLQTNSTSAVGGRIVVVEAQQHPQPQQQQLLMPSSAMGIKSRQNFKMSRQKRVAGSRGGYNDQSWQERDRKMIDGADVNSD